MTKRQIGIGGLILSIIAIGIWAVLPKHSGSTEVAPAVRAAEVKPSDAASDPGSTQPVAVDSGTPFGGRVNKTAASQPGAQSPPQSLTSMDMSVVGQQFTMSPSIEAGCNDPGLKAVHFCKSLKDNLAVMSKEPRDTAWAAEMESKLQAFVSSQGLDPSSIRDVECRSSWCAIEVASESKAFVAVIPYRNPLNKQLGAAADSWATGSESDPTGATILIVVQMYRRR